MANAVLSRGMTSVTIPLHLEGGEGLAVARDVGKPNLTFQKVGTEDPRATDHFSGLDNWTIRGTLKGASAYTDAETLVSLIKTRATTGTPLQLDLTDLPNRSTYDVAPLADSSLQLEYRPGETDMVHVQLSLRVISGTVGGPQTTNAASTPDSGSGIKIETTGGSSVTLDQGLRVTREVGRPGGETFQQPSDLPRYHDVRKPASDVFEISGTLTTTAESTSNTLEETIMRPRLGTDTLTLHFLSNLFSLDAYTVVPMTSQAVRTTFDIGETGLVTVPTMRLRVVDNT